MRPASGWATWVASHMRNGDGDGRSRSISSEQSSEHGDVIGACWVGPDVKDHVILFVGDLPLSERAAPSLGGGECLQLLPEAGLRLVSDLKKMTAASSAGTALCRQSLPSLYPCGAVIRAQCASNGQLDDLWAVSALHRCMVPDDLTRDPKRALLLGFRTSWAPRREASLVDSAAVSLPDPERTGGWMPEQASFGVSGSGAS